MRLRANTLAIAVVLLFAVQAAAGQPQFDQAAGDVPTDAEIAQAIESVKADPNITPEQTIKTLDWKDPSTRRNASRPAWLTWVAEFFGWIAQSTRVMIWIAAGVLAAILVIYISRIVAERSGSDDGEAFIAPTHVRDLDIRPESLPDDLGGAARALWDRGEHRAALALLYRGMLSRLAHVHKVPIRDSSTEGDCLTLSERYLSPSRWHYVSRLVNVWLPFVYAGQDIQAATVYVLCDDFSSNLDAGGSPNAPEGGAA